MAPGSGQASDSGVSAMDVSIIICTRDRAAFLEKTLASIKALKIPPGWEAELAVVDNGSSDDTRGVTERADLGAIKKLYVYEPRKGQVWARNRGLQETTGAAILFTDDDVIPSPDWVEKMAKPLLQHECDAVAGKIQLDPALKRGWMTGMHLSWLAEALNPARESPELIGANMGFHRDVLKKIPGFDVELGPGAHGFGDDTLFWKQLMAANLKIKPVLDSLVRHFPDAGRFLRRHWLVAAQRHGASTAYTKYHWNHEDVPNPRIEWFLTWLKLKLRRLIKPQNRLDGEGCSAWEMSYVAQMAKCRQFRIEKRRPRNYERHGLVKKNCGPDTVNSASGIKQPQATR